MHISRLPSALYRVRCLCRIICCIILTVRFSVINKQISSGVGGIRQTHPSGFRRLRLLQQVPDFASQFAEPTGAEVFSGSHLKTLRLFTHLLEHVLLALVIAVLAARLQVQLVDAPVLEVVGERQDAHLLDEVKLTGAVEVEHGRERPRVTVEVELHSVQAGKHGRRATMYTVSRQVDHQGTLKILSPLETGANCK